MKNPSLRAFTICAPLAILSAAGSAIAGPLPLMPSRYPEPQASAEAPRVQLVGAQMGGGFLEFLFGGGNRQFQPDPYRGGAAPLLQQSSLGDPARPALDPRFMKQMVQYGGNEKPGTIVIDTQSKFLYLVQGNGQALRYGVGVGREGFLWRGTKQVSQKREWPDWTPPAEMLQRRPDLPRHMEGGPENPLGARAMYLGDSLYRIHGSNEPWTIGTNVSSGCIRMRNEDVMDLYERVKVGTKVVVI
jgi:lipoprotein-anchoring transpeptidase ErfK/SrfK